MNKAYEQEIEMWNQVFKECTPVDLRKLDLKVETMFDEALKLFAEKTTNVLDFGCGTGDISTHKVLGIDASKVGIQYNIIFFIKTCFQLYQYGNLFAVFCCLRKGSNDR